MLNTAAINYTDFVFIIKGIVGSSIPAQSIAFAFNLSSAVDSSNLGSHRCFYRHFHLQVFLQLQTDIVDFRTNCCAPFFVELVRIGRSNADTVQFREKCISRCLAGTLKLGYHGKARESTDAEPFFIINLPYVVAAYCPTGMNNVFAVLNFFACTIIQLIVAVRAQVSVATLHYLTLYFGDRSRVVSHVCSIVLSKHTRTTHSNTFSRPFINTKAFSACYLGCQQCCS